jgi:flagellar motor switch/type III secretory pathway protein FliN
MSVLQRKAQAGKQEHQARAMSVLKALRVSTAKVADDLFDLPLAAISVLQEKHLGEGIGKIVDDAALLLLMDGPGGQVGAVAIGPELVSALIQQQTTGRVGKSPPAERRLTATDAALCAPMLEALFKRANGLLVSPVDRDLLLPYRYGSRSENKRLLEMALEAPEYSVIRMTVDIAAGAFQSALTLFLPIAVPQPLAQDDEEDAGPRQASPTLENSVMKLHAELKAVLFRAKLPLARLTSLGPGDTLAIPAEAFESVEVVTQQGRRVARGAMGQVDGMRALRLEHRNPNSDRPQRRASDRPDVDQPSVEPIEDVGPALSHEAVENYEYVPPVFPEIDTGDDLPDLPPMDFDAPEDGFDLPALTDTDDLPELEDLRKLNTA